MRGATDVALLSPTALGRRLAADLQPRREGPPQEEPSGICSIGYGPITTFGGGANSTSL